MASDPCIRLPIDVPAGGALRVELQVLPGNSPVPPQPLHYYTTLLRRPNNVVSHHTFSTLRGKSPLLDFR